ncbi:hypothetical protein LJ655_05930 [Paraburkholderia sp. MMS20-SJTN17]|uniref:Uncharacterized protein n=1 Tax=Paraburkholderia translucens TaxID=2886945 RepID=A0ABS8K9K3_9BURK|nr:hypothetical protein [Paraburkholderia sp. MMS20-SJTN17]MCC8401436.1 hypothetical protein [Paraburkholderia sp. MMS20-SJTN17]
MNNTTYRNAIGFEDIPTFHDAELIKIEHHPSERELQLQFQRVGGTTGTFRFTGVVSQRMVDFAEQNVVSRLLISPAYRFSTAEVGQWLSWVDGRVDSRSPVVDVSRITRCVEDLAAGRRALFVLEPSCGAEGVVLCEAIELCLETDA